MFLRKDLILNTILNTKKISAKSHLHLAFSENGGLMLGPTNTVLMNTPFGGRQETLQFIASDGETGTQDTK